MLKINGTDLEFNRGDEVELFFSFSSNPPEEGTVVFFGMNILNGRRIIMKETVYHEGQIYVYLSSNDTDIPSKEYTYGLYVRYDDGNGYSPLAESRVTVKPSEAYPGKVMI